jgi:hypothetical protein
MHYLEFTFEEVSEEFDVGSIDVHVGYHVTPGEPRVLRYPDGSGYPGSPAQVEIRFVYVDSVTDWDNGEPINVTDSKWIQAKAEELVNRELEEDPDCFLENLE